MIDYSMGTVEDIGAKEDKKDKKRKIEKNGDVEWYTKVEGTPPGLPPVWIFNSNLLNMFLRQENTANNWIFWYPWRVSMPGVFQFAMGEINFSDFVPHNVKNKGIEWNTKYVDGNGTHHPNPHYLRAEWTTGFTVKYLKPELQEQKYNENTEWWVTWNKAAEPEGNMVTHVVPPSSGCPATKQEMIAPFLKWLEEHHDRTQALRRKKAELYAKKPEHRDFMIKSRDQKGTYKPPIPPLDWPREKFSQLLAPWFAQPEDTPEGAILDDFVVHVKLLDAAQGDGKLEPPPGFIAYRRGRATGDNVPKPGEPKPKDRSFKVDEPIYIGPRWKQWRKGQDGEKHKPSKPKKGTEQKESKGFLMVRELAPRACWLTYINAQTSGSSGDANKQASAKVDETDEAAQAKKAAAAAVLEQNRSAHSRALARREEAQRAGGMGGSNDPMPDAAATKRKKDNDSGIPSDSDEEDDDDFEDDEAAADDLRQPLVNKPAARDKKEMTLEEMQERRDQLLKDGYDSDSDDEEQGDQ